MKEDSLIQLIKVAIVSPDRRELYLSAVPKMTAEEKLLFGIQLWKNVLDKSSQMAKAKLEIMIENMSETGEQYSEKDFLNVREEIINDLMRKKLRVDDQSEIDRLRTQLAQLPLE
ncbi:hypothetical protein GW793_04110 [bacterium]|uniref:Uncharacterized protein n=1 Tax=candidate division WWE3 bacterium CG22_combo_CG10-13_8_21_14_all_39_12 TaxID=1975094 RepID=A0A2H0BF91_UNCKA|nr:hypothetical protein [bacterium]PIP56336.1 MAG: hypothetical protein COX05_03650 [candidate division WWE3 bacterium CG22_combo_CG10-13_8_21_14_all_39_12]